MVYGLTSGRGRKLGLALVIALTSVLVTACAAKKDGEGATSALHPNYSELAPRSIAVLPFDNMSTDLDATPLIRPIVAKRLRYMGYQVPDLKRTDEILKEEGVMVSHDVYAFTAQELGQMVGTDAVMFGMVTDFTTKYAGVYASVAVQLRLELVDCRTGEILWQNEARAAENTAIESLLTLLMYHDEIEKGLAVVAAGNAIWAALESYRPYAEKAAAVTLTTLPAGPQGARTYPYDPDDKVNTKGLIYHSIISTSPPD